MSRRRQFDAATALREIIDGTLTGSIQGVQFDLRHNAIDVRDWHAPDELLGTGLIFPWDDEYTGEGDGNDVGPSGATSIRVHEGDTVTIIKVERWNRGRNPALDDPHDSIDLWAKLGILRRSGELEALETTVNFVARDAMGPRSEYFSWDIDEDYEAYVRHFHTDFGRILHRIERLSRGKESAHDDWLSLALTTADEAREWLIDPKHDKLLLATVADLAATAGYALAKAEAEAKLEPLAKAKVKADRDRARASDAGAAKRRKPDTPKLKERAAEMCRENPGLSLTRCCVQLGEEFGRDPANIKPLVIELFRPRQSKTGRKEYRPKSLAD